MDKKQYEVCWSTEHNLSYPIDLKNQNILYLNAISKKYKIGMYAVSGPGITYIFYEYENNFSDFIKKLEDTLENEVSQMVEIAASINAKNYNYDSKNIVKNTITKTTGDSSLLIHAWAALFLKMQKLLNVDLNLEVEGDSIYFRSANATLGTQYLIYLVMKAFPL
jgi:hypothetical protein